MPPWDAPILPGAPPAVGECAINAPAVTIVKRQPLYIEADSRNPAAGGSKSDLDGIPLLADILANVSWGGDRKFPKP